MRRMFGTVGLVVLVAAGLLVAFQFWSTTPLPEGVKADKVLVLKGERQLLLLKDDKPLKTYNVALGWEPRGHKAQEGDGKTTGGAIQNRLPQGR